MRGIATVDRLADEDFAAIWITSRSARGSLEATHGNAVTLDLVNDRDAIEKVRSHWLRTDEERRRRTVRPRTGESPWIMPEELNQAEVAEFPPAFAARVRSQPLT